MKMKKHDGCMIEADIDLHDIEIEEGYMTITVEPTQLDDAKQWLKT